MATPISEMALPRALPVRCCRWLAEKLGANPTTVSGLSGLGDIMLTCYGDLSRNR